MDAKDAEIRSASRQEQGHQRRYNFSLHLSVILPKNSIFLKYCDIFEICFNWWRKAISLKIPHIKWASGWREMQEEEEEEEEKGLSYPDFPPSAESRRRRRRGGGLYDR